MSYLSICQSWTESASKNNFSIDINTEVICQTKNIIYVIECKKCKEQYVRESNRTLHIGSLNTLGYVRNKHFNKVTGEHCNLRGHSQSDMLITIVEKNYNSSDQFRKQRERMFISKFNTKYKGMNKKR